MNRIFSFIFSSALLIISAAHAGDFDAIPLAAQKDAGRLFYAASRLNKTWPEQPPIPEIDAVAQHGAVLAPMLVIFIGLEPDGRQAEDFIVTAEQQIELALCRIFSVKPVAGETVFGASLPLEKNRAVKAFWLQKIGAQPPLPVEPTATQPAS